MTDQNEKDRQIHENLQRLSQHLVFPQEPREQKRDQWQALLSERQPAPRIVARGANLMKRHRTLTVIGSGALAASVLLAVLLVSTSAPAVSAAVILSDLRLALGESILIQFRNVELDYADLAARVPSSQLKRGTVSCNGRVFVPNRPTQEAFWTMESARLRGLSASWDGTDGFSADAELIACLREESPWFFLKMSDAPLADPAEFGPQAAILEALRGGIYVTLPSLAFDTHDEGNDRQVRIISPEFSNLRDLQRVLGRLEEIATDITVEETKQGLFVLTAKGFQDGVALPVPEGSDLSPGARQGLEAWLRDKMKDQIVEVGYRMNEGVRWISVRHFGTPDGRIDIQLADVEFDDRLFDLDYHLERRPAPVVDASALLALVDMFDRAATDEPQ
jgi:hypothetical protein